MKIAVLVIAVLLLSGCGSKIDGTYCDSSGALCYTFASNGTVLMSTKSAYGIGGLEGEMKYEVDGDKIKILTAPQGGASLVLTMLKDGPIQGPMGVMKLTKEKK